MDLTVVRRIIYGAEGRYGTPYSTSMQDKVHTEHSVPYIVHYTNSVLRPRHSRARVEVAFLLSLVRLVYTCLSWLYPLEYHLPVSKPNCINRRIIYASPLLLGRTEKTVSHPSSSPIIPHHPPSSTIPHRPPSSPFVIFHFSSCVVPPFIDPIITPETR